MSMQYDCECGCGEKVQRTIAASGACRVRIFRTRCNETLQSCNEVLQNSTKNVTKCYKDVTKRYSNDIVIVKENNTIQ